MDKVEKVALNLMVRRLRVTSVECWMQQQIAVEKEKDWGESESSRNRLGFRDIWS